MEIGRTRTTDGAVGHQRNLVLNALSDWQPVQCVTKYPSDELVESAVSDEVCPKHKAMTYSLYQVCCIATCVPVRMAENSARHLVELH